jgi:hypothetical protein
MPLTICKNKSCQECNLQEIIHCQFRLVDFVKFTLSFLPCFLIGALGIRQVSVTLLYIWIGLCIIFFGFIEIRVLCSHCPHYAQPGRFLLCWANRGGPKIWRYRPGLLSAGEKTVLAFGFGIVLGYPAVVMAVNANWFLLMAYLAGCAGFYFILKRYFCSRCLNFACPLNGVSQENKDLFNDLNPGAW